MSEIKGQLLGIILTIAVFGVVFGVLMASFKNSASSIGVRMDEAMYQKYEEEVVPAAPAAPSAEN